MEDSQYLSVDWQEYHTLTQSIADQILTSETPFATIIAIGRGGLTFGHLLSDFLRIPICSITIQSYTDIKKQGEVKITEGLSSRIAGKRVLLVDDIADSGATLKRATSYLRRFRPESIAIATLFYKPHSTVRPDYFAKQTDLWILQPFEVTEWVTTFSTKMKKKGASEKDIQSFLLGLGYTNEQIAFVRRHFIT